MRKPSQFAVADHWADGFDEEKLERWARDLRAQLQAPRVSLGLVFMSPRFFDHASQVLELLRVHAQITLLAGCSSQGLIVNDQEIESDAGLVLCLYALPGADLKAFHLTQSQVEAATNPGYWPSQTGIHDTNGWLVFADPFHLDGEKWLRSWNADYASTPTLGGLASGDFTTERTQVYWNGEVFDQGGIAISVGGDVALAGLISQGCTPIGETWTITKADQNIIQQIGNRPAYEVVVETFNNLPPSEQQRTRGNLFVGLVVNEYLEEFHRGDFLVRNLLGADPKSGAIAVGAHPRAGQTIQFQRRDAAAATEDMVELLEHTKGQLKGAVIYGGCLCNCNGRGHRLFGERSHDARLVQEQLGPFAMGGFFCNGQIGPIGQRNFLHGYTASLALFVKKNKAAESIQFNSLFHHQRISQ